MQKDYLFNSSDRTKSTYFEERGDACMSNMVIAYQYRKIEKDIKDATDINQLKKTYEIKQLDKDTGLNKLKYDKVRVIHFLYQDGVFVFLGTFIKKTGKTPPDQIKKNNERIKRYLEQKNGGE